MSKDVQIAACGSSQHGVGETVGYPVGLVVGSLDGPRLGEVVGRTVGETDGLVVGVRVGRAVGFGVSHTPHRILQTLLMSKPVGLQMVSLLMPATKHSAGSAFS